LPVPGVVAIANVRGEVVEGFFVDAIGNGMRGEILFVLKGLPR
jgi:hypothetical protein